MTSVRLVPVDVVVSLLGYLYTRFRREHHSSNSRDSITFIDSHSVVHNVSALVAFMESYILLEYCYHCGFIVITSVVDLSLADEVCLVGGQYDSCG